MQPITAIDTRRGGAAAITGAEGTKVLLVTEGTYPFHFGGVSTWCHALIRRLPDIEFSLLSIIDGPHRAVCFELPKNLVEFRSAPLWGVHGQRDWAPLPTADRRRRLRATTEAVVAAQFAPLVAGFVDLLLGPGDDEAMAAIVHRLHVFLVDHDFDAAVRSPAVWEAFCAAVGARFPALADEHGLPGARVALSDLTEGLQCVRAWLAPLAERLPKVDVVHTAMAGMCTLVAVAAKWDQGAGFLFTEHGIYLRECYLAEADTASGVFLKLLRLRFALRMTQLAYAQAHQISPCCDHNQRWELFVGAAPDRLSTIHYGVDASVFRPAEREPGARPTVVWVARIDPLKDVETLLRAASLVQVERPDIVFRLYGAALPGMQDYYDRCVALREELDLEETVELAGYTSTPQAAFNEGDLVVLSSISEGFPYTILEAMLCSRPIVATDVGGIAEQIGDCGVVVEPRNPVQMAEAILGFMNDPERLVEVGRRARSRAEQLFSVENERDAHIGAYSRVIDAMAQEQAPPDDAAPPPRSLPRAAPTLPRRLEARSESRPQRAARAAAVDHLADEVAKRVVVPVDAMEVTAQLESLGVTDGFAAQHGLADVFELGRRVLARLRARRTGLHASPPFEPLGSPPSAKLMGDAARYALTAASGLMAVFAVRVAAAAGGLPPGQAWALMLGALGAVMLGNTLLQGLTPRASLYLGCDNWPFAWLLVRRFVRFAAGVAVAVGALLYGASLLLGLGQPSERTAFVIGYAAAVAPWIASGGLVVAQRLHEVGAAILAGAGAAVLVAGAAAPFVEIHGYATIAVGYALTMTVLVARTRRIFAAAGARGPRVGALPPTSQLLAEAAPFSAHALLVLILLMAPHGFGWLALPDAARSELFLSLQLALNAPLLALFAATVVIQRSARRFWLVAKASQMTISLRDRPLFTTAMAEFRRRERRAVLLTLVAGEALVVGALAAAQATGRLDRLLGDVGGGQLLRMMVLSALGYACLGVLLLDAMFLNTLRRAKLLAWSIAAGAAAALLAGAVVVGLLGPAEAPAVLTVGAAGAAAGAARRTNAVLQRSDSSYAAAL